MTKKIILLLSALTVSISAFDARIHNCTGYNFVCEEWHLMACKKQTNIQLPKNTTTTISWGACTFQGAKFGATINNTFVTNILNFSRTISKSTYDFYIFAEAPIVTVENPLYPGQSVTETKYVRFYIWKTPALAAPGGLFAVSDWYNTITGVSDNDGAKKAGLDIKKPSLSI